MSNVESRSIRLRFIRAGEADIAGPGGGGAADAAAALAPPCPVLAPGGYILEPWLLTADGGAADAIGGTLVSVVARGLVAGGAPLGAAGAGGPVAEACAAACAAGAS